MIVPRLTFFTMNFVIRGYQVTKIFRSGHDRTSTSSARSPYYFRLQADVLSGSECRYCACPSPVPLLLAPPLVIHEKNWKCPDPQAPGFLVALQEHFHQPKFLCTPVGSPAVHAIDRHVLLRVLHFYLCFWFLLVSAAGFPVIPHSFFHFFLDTGF